MNHPNENSSMSTPSSSADWPKDAVPQAWVEELFRKLSSYFGSRLADMWRGSEIDAVKREWGVALAKLSRAEWKAGVGALISLKYPPTLPEFWGICKQTRLYEAASESTQITDQTRASPEVVEANMKRIREAKAPLMQPKEPTAEWAYRLLMRGESDSGKPLPYEVIHCASDAIFSQAGRKVVENCVDAELAESYRSIRAAVISGYRNAGKTVEEQS
jgi:hypothetical protein